jgi:hypothetical protein
MAGPLTEREEAFFRPAFSRLKIEHGSRKNFEFSVILKVSHFHHQIDECAIK